MNLNFDFLDVLGVVRVKAVVLTAKGAKVLRKGRKGALGKIEYSEIGF